DSVEPVKETTATSGWCSNASPTVPPGPKTMFTTPSGKPASYRISTNRSALKGVSLAGLITTVFPATSAGNIFHVGIAIGKFHGVIQATTPIGSRMANPDLFGSSTGTLYP